MPKIEIINARGQLPSLRLPRPTAEDFGAGAFKAVGEFGQALGKIDQDIRAVEEAEAGAKILTGTAQRLDDEYERLSREADHNTFLPSYSDIRTKAHGEALEQVKSLSRSAQAALIPHLERVTTGYQARANQKSRELKAAHTIAETTASLPALAALAAKAETPEERARWEGLGQGRVQSLKGLLGEPRIVELREIWQKHIAAARERYFNGPMADRLNEIANRATLEPENASLYQREAFNLIDGADWLPVEKRAEEKTKIRSNLWFGAVKTLIDRDPVGTLKQLNAAQYSGLLSQQGLISLRTEAENEIEKRQRKAEAERKEREREIGKLVSDYEDAKMAGVDLRGPFNEAPFAQPVKIQINN